MRGKSKCRNKLYVPGAGWLLLAEEGAVVVGDDLCSLAGNVEHGV